MHAFFNELSSKYKWRELSYAPVSGGDINQAFRLNTDQGVFFLKANQAPQALQMFEAEAKGLGLLAQGPLLTPNVIDYGRLYNTAYLLLEYIAPSRPTGDFFIRFGDQLAQLHQITSPSFGLDQTNYIGTLLQKNPTYPDWPSFYWQARIQPQLNLAAQNQLFTPSDLQCFDRLPNILQNRCPNEPSALIHGDLWSGNYLCTQRQEVVLIDPAVCFAHREMDLAMTLLFGGYPASFYESYHDTYPLELGWRDRMGIYQLYYLLVHVNLFGGSYVRQCIKLMNSL